MPAGEVGGGGQWWRGDAWWTKGLLLGKNQGDLRSDSWQRIVTGRRWLPVTAESGRGKKGGREEEGEFKVCGLR